MRYRYHVAVISYDALNRLSGAVVDGNSTYGWTYDSFGNRLTQTGDGGMDIATWVDLSGSPHNQVTSTNARGVPLTVTPPASLYDGAGNMNTDGANTYYYDADGRVCATFPAGSSSGTQYLYNASGQRVAKGTIQPVWVNGQPTSPCDTTQNQFTLTNQYILGPSGEQMTEINYNGSTPTWVHTNVVTPGMIATYLNDGTASPHFRLTDWLGTTRVQTDSAGNVELTCQSLPFGDPSMPSCTATPATEQFFTSYERDQESGNDYAQARHYASSMGRFLSPDPSGILLADLTNPQSLNQYGYVRNNPLVSVDPTGLDGCQVEGVDVNCSSINSESAVACPNNNCDPVNYNGQFYQFVAGAGGAQGYVPYSDPTGAFNEWGGQFVNDQQYAAAVQQATLQEIYAAYMLGVSKGSMTQLAQAGVAHQVDVRHVGFTNNVQIRDDILKDLNGYRDPEFISRIFHGGLSVYYGDAFDRMFGSVGHVAAGAGNNTPPGLEAHYDDPGPWNPEHWIESLLSMFINPRGSAMAVGYTCAAGVGCW